MEEDPVFQGSLPAFLAMGLSELELVGELAVCLLSVVLSQAIKRCRPDKRKLTKMPSRKSEGSTHDAEENLSSSQISWC